MKTLEVENLENTVPVKLGKKEEEQKYSRVERP